MTASLVQSLIEAQPEKFVENEGAIGALLDSGEVLSLDFDNNKVDYRRRALRGQQELIVRALAGGEKNLSILDLSAGLGIDAVFLSQMGFSVTSLERNPIIYVLLVDALKRSQREDLQSLRFIFEDSRKYLQDLSDDHPYGAAYFDPMYPEKKKSALPRKEMRLFRNLVGADPDGKEVVQLALEKKIPRVVVKRPLPAEALLMTPQHSFKGHSVRYDLYVPGNLAASDTPKSKKGK